MLNALYSEEQAQAIHKHIDYVIGISPELSDRAAIEFAVGFYDALGAGRSYERAYRSGCTSLKMSGFLTGSTPVLLHRGAEAIVPPEPEPSALASPNFSEIPSSKDRSWKTSRLNSRTVPVRQSSFLERGDRIVVMAAGGAAIGALFGRVPGVIIGAVLGAIYGWYSSNEKASPGRKN